MRVFLRKHKEVIYSLILAFVVSFMIFLVEPISLYANNINDFWFDLSVLAPALFQFFALSFAAIFLILLCFVLLAKKFKKPLFFFIPFLIAFTVFLIAYIHGNFFSAALPPFDGEVINWHDFLTEHIISTIICIVIILAIIITSVKFTPAKVSKITSYLTIAIFAMLSVSLASTFLTTDAFKTKEVVTYATPENLNTFSNDRNFLILLVDATDSERFREAVGDSELYRSTFADFTYFPDTVGAYNLTRDSIPFIFSGLWDRNETDFITYSTNAFNESPLFSKLASSGYTMNFYENDFIWYDRKAFIFDNITSRTKNIDNLALFKQEVKYILFKYSPYPLKRFSRVDSIDFAATQVAEEAQAFVWDDVKYYENATTNPISLTNDKVFQFLHLEGAHVPYNLDENLNIIEDGTYSQKCAATLKLINAYLERLKAYSVYDNSSIIIMADHGANNIANPNPILYIKGLNEHHTMSTSEKAVWYPDLLDMYNELLAGQSSSEIFSHVGEEHRDRYIIQIPFRQEEHMTEWVQTGKAWDASTLKKTGKEFNL